MIEFSLVALIEVVVIIVLAWLIGHILALGVIKFSRRVSEPQRITITRWIRTVTVLIGIIVVLSVLGLETQLELLTVAGIGAFVISMALEGTFANVLSGLFTFRENTLRVGDVVEVGSGAGKGHVVKVGLRNVWVKTDGGALVVLGHATLDHGRYWNYTAAERLKKNFDV